MTIILIILGSVHGRLDRKLINRFYYFTAVKLLSFLYVCMVNAIYFLSFVETPRKFTIAELSIRELGSSSVITSSSVLLAMMKIRAQGSKALQ